MEKESGIETLIELLNEYKKIKGYDGNTKITNYDTDTGSFTNGYSGLEYEIVIGKRYGFIKWLVENDKIDREKFGNSETKSSKYSDYELSYDTPREDYTNILLMELAIQDEPIQFLIEILR